MYSTLTEINYLGVAYLFFFKRLRNNLSSISQTRVSFLTMAIAIATSMRQTNKMIRNLMTLFPWPLLEDVGGIFWKTNGGLRGIITYQKYFHITIWPYSI